MTPEERMLIEGINGRLDAIETRQETIRVENRADHANLFDALHNISKDGCAVGKTNAKDIKALMEQPARAVAVGGADSARRVHGVER